MDNDKIILSNKIEIIQDQSIYDFIGQFQSTTDKILCLVNKSKLHLYSDNDENFPKKIKLSHKDHTNNSMTIYHFNDLDTGDTYCLFGKKQVCRFLSNISKKSTNPCKFNHINSNINPITNNHLVKMINEEITIIDDNIKITFTNHNLTLETETIID